LARILSDEGLAEVLTAASMGEGERDPRTDRERAMCVYARRLTLTPAEVDESDIVALREAGLDDGEILDLNQVVSYFAYVNRSVLGLGVPVDEGHSGSAPTTPPIPTGIVELPRLCSSTIDSSCPLV
jgi:uncharacterized peroxidase-related enzyme